MQSSSSNRFNALSTKTPERFMSELKSASDKDMLIQELHHYINSLEEERAPQAQFFNKNRLITHTSKLCAAGKLMLILMGQTDTVQIRKKMH